VGKEMEEMKRRHQEYKEKVMELKEELEETLEQRAPEEDAMEMLKQALTDTHQANEFL